MARAFLFPKSIAAGRVKDSTRPEMEIDPTIQTHERPNHDNEIRRLRSQRAKIGRWNLIV